MNILKALCLVLALASAALADRITLKDGRVYEGAIVEESDKGVKIRTARATITFPRDQVEKIERASSPVQERDTRLEALDPSAPAKYVEAAEWLSGQGPDVYDPELVRRLCNLAAGFDQKLIARANMALGRDHAAHGRGEDAAEAFARAAAADPQNPDARRKAEEYLKEREAAARRRWTDLRDALSLAAQGQTEAALPKLRAARNVPGVEDLHGWLRMTLDELIRDLQRRVACKPCAGSGLSKCSLCKGTGLIKCSACGGDGKKAGVNMGKAPAAFNNLLCRTCTGIGTSLCGNCHAERDIGLCYDITYDKDYKPVMVEEIVHCVAGKEKDCLRPKLDFREYTRPSDNKPLLAIIVHDISKGGTRNCGTCGGVKFEPPAGDPDFGAMRACVTEIDARLKGGASLLRDDAVSQTFDPEPFDSGEFWFRKGKWSSVK